MEVGDSEEDLHISDGNLSEEGQVDVKAYGSSIAAQDRAQDFVPGDKIRGFACCFKSFFL